MNDELIKKSEVIEIVENLIYDMSETDTCILNLAKAEIEKLPSVQPKTGRWEPLFGTVGKVFECSECGAAVTVAYECFKDGCYYDYCPNCGAKMEGEVK